MEGRVLPYSPAYLVEFLIGGDTLRYVGVGFLGLTLPLLYVPLCIKEVKSPFFFAYHNDLLGLIAGFSP